MGAPLHAQEVDAARARMAEWQIAALAERDFRTLSSGQLRLCFLARALMGDPEVLLLDEPCSGLDTHARAAYLARLQRVRAERDTARVGETLNALRHAAQKQNENLMPYLLDAVNAYATLQEMMDLLRREWGEYREEAIV